MQCGKSQPSFDLENCTFCNPIKKEGIHIRDPGFEKTGSPKVDSRSLEISPLGAHFHLY